MMPDTDGMSLLAALRRKGIFTPVILATALDGLHDRIDGLDAGADDYIVKPFDVEELMARIRAVTRRPGVLKISPDLTFAGITFHPEQHLASYQDTSVTLSKKEAALFEYFMRKAKMCIRDRNLAFSRAVSRFSSSFSAFFSFSSCCFTAAS